jgi:hypothetical protein
LIQNDPYLKGWNDSIFGNATAYDALVPVAYHMDNSSGILDNAREIKMRIKAFAYVYRMTNNTKWVERTWLEIQVSSAVIPFFARLNRAQPCDRTPPATVPQRLDPTLTNGIQPISSTLPNSLLRLPLHTTGYMIYGLMHRKNKSDPR